jgi:GT2 family glycosyltransferase
VGAFDPDFFMYGEEMDWCRRLARAGYGVLFLPEPGVVHLGGASSRPLAGAMFVELLKSRVRYLRKYLGGPEAAACTLLLAVGVVARWASWEGIGALRGLGQVDRERLDLRLRMFRGGARWVFGGCRLAPPALPAAAPTGSKAGGPDVA